MQSIGQELEGRISARFETESDPVGKPWEEWAESTRAAYPYSGTDAAKSMGGPGAGRILDRYSDMLGSLNWDADASSVRIGFGQFYATFHEFGTKNMPRRGLLFDDPEAGTIAPGDERMVIELLEEWLAP